MRYVDKIVLCLLVVNIVSFAAVSIVIRFRHPELTETQLFVDYWQLYLLNFVTIAFGLIALRDD